MPLICKALFYTRLSEPSQLLSSNLATVGGYLGGYGVPRVAAEMKAIQVARLKDPGMHAVGKVPGLHLQVTDTGARSWILRATIGGKRCEMGLGSYPEVTLAAAHEAAAALRAEIRAGGNPLQKRREARNQANAERVADVVTFRKCATSYIQANAAGWANAKHKAKWESSLANWVYPHVADVSVRDVALSHVLAVLEQPVTDGQESRTFWVARTETASRVRGRIESILDWAAARGLRTQDNPARWRGHLDKLMPKPSKVATVEHHKALPVSEMPAFMKALRACTGTGALALEFAILTAARSGEVRGATWGEFDLEAKVWTIPAERMKAGREHAVPLCEAALAVLGRLHEREPGGLVFPAPRGGMLSDMTLTAVLRRLGVDATVHGFRSTFRDWCGDHTNYPRDLAEMALAHTIKDKAEAAYRRGDMLARRVPMME